MATNDRSDDAAAVKTAKKTSKGTASKKAAPTGNTARIAKPAAKEASGAEGLLRAGLKALGNVRNDVVKRQTHVIESLLGVRVNDTAVGFGFKKFEDVFDQRVATALERLGLPDAREVQVLRDEVEALRARLAALEAAGSGHASEPRKPAKPARTKTPVKKLAARRNAPR